MKTIDELLQISSQEFLQKFWNKNPLFIKNSLPTISKLATKSDFIEMSYDDYFETRMVIEKGGEYPWQLIHGPFKEKDFTQKSRQQTLICHKINLYHEAFNDLAKTFQVIPKWEFDDVMATISDKDASLGAHIDNYGVFIIQGSGKRKWQLQVNPEKGYKPDLDIRLLETFNPTHEYILEPGDVLYIPPHVAHHGITMEESISYSVGFKSLNYDGIFNYWTSESLPLIDEYDFYQTSYTKEVADPLELTANTVDDMHAHFMQNILNKNNFEISLLKYLSRATGEIESNENYTSGELTSFPKTTTILKDENTQCLYRKKEEQIYLAVNEALYLLNESSFKAIAPILNIDHFTPVLLSSLIQEDNSLICELLNTGAFYLNDETEA